MPAEVANFVARRCSATKSGVLMAVALSSLNGFTLAAFAQTEDGQAPNWYLGGGLTYTDISAGSFGGLNSSSASTDADTGTVFIVGYTIGPHLAVELGYLDAGAPHFESRRGLLCADPDLCRVEVEQETKALTVAAAGIVPLGRIWAFHAKVGLAAWDAQASQTFTAPSGGASSRARADLDGTDLLIGLGVSVAVASRLRIRLDYEFFDTDDALLGVDRSAGFQQFAVELLWHF